jgi:sarcosine oxidase subunit gamma
MPDIATLAGGVAIAELTGLGRLSLRGGPLALAAAGQAFGVPLPLEACRATEGEARAALWLGPDEQLLLVQQADWESVISALAARLAGMPHSLVDISQRQVALQVSGERAAELLNSGCPLDLHPQAFPPGMCTRTLFAKAPIVLWRTAANTFHIEVWRSFARYLQQLLLESARESEPEMP